MNEGVVALGLGAWKPLAGALVAPPAPLLALVLLGALLLARRRAAMGWVLLATGVAGAWFSATTVAADLLERTLLDPPAALAPPRIAALRAEVGERGGTAIVVLGGGAEPLAPEYGTSNLGDASLQRLRYGLWLARRTGAPVGFSGGIGWAGREGPSEAEVAARIAAEEFAHPLRWTETTSRDTRENAARMLPLLQRAGIRHVLLVTNGWHMPRALRHFERVAAPLGIAIEPAPMGLARRAPTRALDWLPTPAGFVRVRQAVHELLGRAAGA